MFCPQDSHICGVLDEDSIHHGHGCKADLEKFEFYAYPPHVSHKEYMSMSPVRSSSPPFKTHTNVSDASGEPQHNNLGPLDEGASACDGAKVNTAQRDKHHPGSISVLIVHHGYDAESMVNAHDIGLELRRRGESVAIFSREADPSRGDYEIRETKDGVDCSIPVFLVNAPRHVTFVSHRNPHIDHAFRNVMTR